MDKKKIINLSIDSKLFDTSSAAASRFVEYGKLFSEVHVIVYTRPGFKETTLAPNVFLHPTNTWWKPLYFFKAYRLAQKYADKDSIVTSQEALTNIIGVLLKNKIGTKLQIQIHTDFMNPLFRKESLKNRIRYLFYKWTIPKADFIRVVSGRILDSIKPFLKCPPERVSVLPLFVDKKMLIEQTSSLDIRSEYPQFSFILLMASRFEIEKNIAMAFSVFKKVLKYYPRTGLLVVGKGSEKRKLYRQVKKLGLKKNIVFINWTENIGDYYKAANAFLVTSNYEGYGLTLIEAALAELPIVTTDVGIAGELFEDEKDALICKPQDSVCFLSNLLKLIEDNALRKTLALNAREKAMNALMNKDDYMKAYQAMFDK